MSREILLVDTSILTEILQVPGKSNPERGIITELKNKITHDDELFLPLATILETGNHIAQSRGARYDCAHSFVNFVNSALAGASPFKTLQFWNQEDLVQWISEFPSEASAGRGIGDLSIIKDFEKLKTIYPSAQPIRIWSLDTHLSSFVQQGN